MLKKRQKLNLKIKHHFQQSITTPFFTIKIGQNGTRENKYAVVTGKKIDKRATVRNKIKRMIFSSIQDIQNIIKPGQDMLIIAKNNILTMSKEKMSHMLTDVLQKRKFLQ